MAGVKGKSGGARPGSGPKPKPKAPPHQTPPPARDQPTQDDALAYLLRVVADAMEDPKLRVRAAIAAVQYQRVKAGDGGKKEDQASRAKKASSGRFASSEPPKLVVNNK